MARLHLASPFRADLPAPVRRLQAGALVNAVGNGLVFPFLFLYLHEVRGLSATTTGLVVGTTGALGLVVTPLAGVLIDRVGGRPTMALSLALLTAGSVGWALAESAREAFAAALLAGAGNGCFWPAQSTLLVALTDGSQRASAFAVQRVMMNLGVGIGGMVGGLVARTDVPATFQALFLGNALTFLLYGAVLTRVPHVPPSARDPNGESPGRYVDVLRHRAFMLVIALNVVLLAAGIAQLEVLPAWAKGEAGVSERGIGLIFLVNTLVIVAASMPVARLVRGRRRMPTQALVGLLWAASWLAVPLAAGVSPGATTLLLCGILAAFAIGECFYGAVQAPLVSDLADPRLIGRYMAVWSLSWNVALFLGPVAAGATLDAAPGVLWPAAATVLLACSAAAMLVERSLPVAVRRTPR